MQTISNLQETFVTCKQIKNPKVELFSEKKRKLFELNNILR